MPEARKPAEQTDKKNVTKGKALVLRVLGRIGHRLLLLRRVIRNLGLLLLLLLLLRPRLLGLLLLLLGPRLLGVALGRRRAGGLGVEVAGHGLGVLGGHSVGLYRREDLNGGIGDAGGDLLAALFAVPVGLLEPVEAAGEGREADADEAEDGAGEAVCGLSARWTAWREKFLANVQLHAFTGGLDACAGALVAHLAVDPLGPVAKEVQRSDLLAGCVHAGLSCGLHRDGLAGLVGTGKR